MSTTKKKTWQVVWDLQCPYSKKNWERLSELKTQFGDEYDFSIHLTSLIFHPQAFAAQCAANWIYESSPAETALQNKQTFIDACYTHQDSYRNAAVGDARPSEVDAIFAGIAEQAGLFNTTTTLQKQDFLAQVHDWDVAVKPAWVEHKQALAWGVVSTPSHVIDGKLVPNTESAWGPKEWTEKLQTLS